eukprot:Plantae.Rhodophyta-Palmaria_palmata.ctg448.p1 GENE.Plantae.Rhodophyta-Palmaria_palmata.ctg448~~Plantae.Rhodophyta-Palmaria_palmata.ctg448.p1  ORF type:complete len:259 (-),score=53.52 Plantae.Rhodophyta-Palmaria_palmata.ctg448:263-1039(-)
MKKDEASSNARKSNAVEKAKHLGWMEKDVEGLEHVKSLLADSAKDLTPLGEASKRVRLLERHAADKLVTHALSFELSIRKGMYLQGLRAIRRARAVDSDHPDVLLMVMRLVNEIEGKGKRKAFSAEEQSVFNTLGDVLGGSSVVEKLDLYVTRHEGNAIRLLGAGEAMLWMIQADVNGARSAEKALQFVADTLRRSKEATSSSEAPRTDAMFVSFEKCAALWRRLLLQRGTLSKDILDLVKGNIQALYPRATGIASYA